MATCRGTEFCLHMEVIVLNLYPSITPLEQADILNPQVLCLWIEMNIFKKKKRKRIKMRGTG